MPSGATAFRKLGPVDASGIAENLHLLEWPPGGEHEGVLVYAMVEHWPVDLPVEEVAGEVLRAYLPGARRGTTLLSRVVPGQTIPEHTDGHDGGCRTRVHVPLATNPRAYMRIGGKSRHMRVGYAYLIDPTSPHSVRNDGRTDRVHLIFNALGG